MFPNRMGSFGKFSAICTLLSCTLLVLGAISTANAATIDIQFTGVNAEYDGSTLFDAGSAAGGVNDPADADPLDTVTFKLDGISQGTISSDIALDFSIPDVTGISSVSPSTVINTPGNPGYFDLLIGTTPSAAQFLRLDTDVVTVAYLNATSTLKFMFGTAVAAVDAQNLPFGLEIGDDVTVSFSTQVDSGSLTTDNILDLVTGFTASGSGEMRGAAVPEPASIAVLVMGLMAAASVRRR